MTGRLLYTVGRHHNEVVFGLTVEEGHPSTALPKGLKSAPRGRLEAFSESAVPNSAGRPLQCAVDELARRVVSPDRRARLKWMDAAGVRSYAAEHDLVPTPFRHALDLDVTTMNPVEVAKAVLAHIEGALRASE